MTDALLATTTAPSNEFEVLAHAFAQAFNDRDADALVALAHPRIVFRPSTLTGPRRTYIGHEGLRRWVSGLAAAAIDYQVHIREIRPLSANAFLVLSKLRVGDDLITDSAMLASLHERRVVEAHGYLSDEQVLIRLGLIPGRAVPAPSPATAAARS